jgi:hypothetical protein
MHNTCRYCGADTVMVKDRKAGRWHACKAGTTQHHHCDHWATAELRRPKRYVIEPDPVVG